MKTRIVEVSNGFNWGKFMLCEYDEDDWARQTSLPGETGGLLRSCGWGPDHLWILDLQTGEGAKFQRGGSARADLNKHKVWVCPMFEEFLVWLYEVPLPFDEIPEYVDLPDAPAAMYGYRREGPTGE